MNLPSDNTLHEFLDEYEQGHFLKALQHVLKHPDMDYDGLYSYNDHLKLVVNYVDACIYKNIVSMQQTNLVLRGVFELDAKLKVLAQQFLETLQWEEKFLYLYAFEDQELIGALFNEEKLKQTLNSLKLKEEIGLQDIEEFTALIPPFYHHFVESKLHLLKGWKEFIKFKPEFNSLLLGNESFTVQQPWHSFAYHLTIHPFENIEEDIVPIIFLEPIEGANYTEILSPYLKRKALVVFETVQHFIQLLKYPEFISFLSAPIHSLYILSLYPQEQIVTQNLIDWKDSKFQPLFLCERKVLREVMPLFLDVFKQCLNQNCEAFKKDTPVANWLYHISKRALFKINAEKYGKSRYIALNLETGNQQWTDLHQGLPPLNADLGPIAKDELLEMVKELNANRKVRKYDPKKKIKIAHITPQVVSPSHAPTRMIINLLRHADKQWFDLFLLSTERFVTHFLEYPISTYISENSFKQSDAMLNYIHSFGVQIHVEPSHQFYLRTAMNIAEVLNKYEIDVAVFHGPDEINTLCACMCDVPIRLVFEHGTFPKYPSFDFAILSTEDGFKAKYEDLKQLGIESIYLPFCINFTEFWEKDPYSKELLGIPADSFLMTTISNHLDTRLSNDMCHLIGRILKRCPKAYYAPIGAVHNASRILSIMEEYGVKERVVLLGQKMNASQYARTMDLYLNEFPFGSGVGILEGMAAGCPIVSMYDEEGPQQARYTGTFFGMDRVIKSGNQEDYFDLACKLIEDKDMYEKWSKHALERYSLFVDDKGYVKKFEKILEVFIDYWQQKSREK